MRKHIEALAARGVPTVSLLLEHADCEIAWPTQNLQVNVFNTGTPAVGFAEALDMLAVFTWLHRDQMLAALDREIDGEADDKAALSIEAREPQTAGVQGDLLDVERTESALVWMALAQGLPAEHRSDCHPLAILGAQLRTVTVVEERGSSPEHAGWDFVGGRAVTGIVRGAARLTSPAPHLTCVPL